MYINLSHSNYEYLDKLKEKNDSTFEIEIDKIVKLYRKKHEI